jgi:hypothetical protein
MERRSLCYGADIERAAMDFNYLREISPENGSMSSPSRLDAGHKHGSQAFTKYILISIPQSSDYRKNGRLVLFSPSAIR